ncbi:hypothetical protein BJX76DRAFT_352245 [Aspergillus varians]
MITKIRVLLFTIFIVLLVCELYDTQHAAKVAMLKDPDFENYVDYLDGIDDPAVELMETVVTYLIKRYPNVFRTDSEYVHINYLNERYRIKEPSDYHPLAVADVLVHEDRIGWQLHQINDPIAGWRDKLRK